MKIAITGGAGFIGTALTEFLQKSGHDIILLDIRPSQKFPELSKIVDITRPYELTEALRGVDAVYHMAAVHRDDVKPLQRYYSVNVGGAENLVAAARQNNIGTIINLSSVAVYGFNTNHSTETDPPQPYNDYGRSKVAAEKIFEQWAAENPKNKLVTVRLSATFGPGNRGNIYNLIEQIARRRFVMVGDGSNYKSIAWVGNVAAFLAETLNFPSGSHLYNYADKPDLSMKDLVGTIRQSLGLRRQTWTIPSSLGLWGAAFFDGLSNLTGENFPISVIRVRKFCANTVVNADKALATGFKPPFSLEQGLQEIIHSEFRSRNLNFPARPKLLYILAEIEDFWSSRLPLALAAVSTGNCEIHVAAPKASHDPKLKDYGFYGHELPEARKGFSLSSALENIKAIKYVLKTVDPDIVHTITLKYSFLTGMIAPLKGKAHYVFTIAGLGYLFSQKKLKPVIMRTILMPYIRLTLRHPLAHITFQNSDDQKILIGAGWVDPKVCTLIRGSGVDLEKFKPADSSAPEKPIVLMPTRLVHDKGVSIFVEMAKILKERGVDARFQIAGGITDQNPMAITIDEMKDMIADSNVEWLGKVSDMPALYKNATLIVYPSWYREGIPRVLLESAASGRAIVTTDHPGCREAVTHNDNGLLVPVRDAVATADAVEKLLRDSNLRHSMERRSRERAEQEFDVNLIAAQTVKVYGF